jgi:hypothetical protein
MGIGAYMFLHHPWSVAVGNAGDMRVLADDLDTLSKGMLDFYSSKAGEDKREEIAALLDGPDGQGTLLSAESAVALGLADNLAVDIKAAASLSETMKAFAKAKADSIKPPETDALSPADVLALGFDLDPSDVESQGDDLAAKILALRNPTVESLRADHPDLIKEIEDPIAAIGDEAAKAAIAEERQRASAIVAACDTTGQTQLCAKLISSGKSAEDASDHILDVAAASSAGILSSHSPEGGQTAELDHNKIYSRLNRKSK